MSKRSNGFDADPERAREAGRKGAATVKERLGSDHFRRMGQAGGAATKAKYGSRYYSTIGKLGGAALRERVRAAREAEAVE